MPVIERPDGAVINYEVFGSGYPVLLIAPGGVNSEIGFWEQVEFNPLTRSEFVADFMMIGMDQRHVGGSWNAPPTYSYPLTTGDQLAVLDDVGVEQAHIWGCCIGVAHVLNVIDTAPSRITAAVCQDPVGLDETNSIDVFLRSFEPTIRTAREQGMAGVVEIAVETPMFVNDLRGGPFARRISEDPSFRAELLELDPEEYVAMVKVFGDGMWPDNPPFFTGGEEWIKACRTPLLVLPGNDENHPTSVAERICATAPDARCLPVGWRSDEPSVEETIAAIHAFLRSRLPGTSDVGS